MPDFSKKVNRHKYSMRKFIFLIGSDENIVVFHKNDVVQERTLHSGLLTDHLLRKSSPIAVTSSGAFA